MKVASFGIATCSKATAFFVLSLFAREDKAQADFTMTYTGTAFNQSLCNQSDYQCLVGNLALKFVIEGNFPSTDPWTVNSGITKFKFVTAEFAGTSLVVDQSDLFLFTATATNGQITSWTFGYYPSGGSCSVNLYSSNQQSNPGDQVTYYCPGVSDLYGQTTVPGSWKIVPDEAIPTNFRQVGVTSKDGILHFTYNWDSNTGNLADLSNCTVSEKVDYPGADPFFWPQPPYVGYNSNPVIYPNPPALAAKGYATDDHSHKPFEQPYTSNTFNASQAYRYRCEGHGYVDFPGESGIIISRTVADSTGKGCWFYTITKSGANASTRLPEVSGASCKTKAYQSRALEADVKDTSLNAVTLAPDASRLLTSLHAPAITRLYVTNAGPTEAKLDFGADGESDLQLKIEKPNGSIVFKDIDSDGLHNSGLITLASHTTWAKELLLNDWYSFPDVGTYHVEISLVRPGSTSQAGAFIRATPFIVQVGPRDPTKLKMIANELSEKALNATTYEERSRAAVALNHIVDPVAVDGLIMVLQKGSLVSSSAAGALGRIGGAKAIAALKAAQDSPDEDIRSSARSALNQARQRNGGLIKPED